MPATKEAKRKDTIAELAGELELLQARHEQATRGAAEARRRAEELAARRADLATPAFFNEAPAVEELAALDVEASNLARSVSLALDAAGSLEGGIQDAKERLAAERVRSGKYEVARLRTERQGVHEQVLAAADELLTLLARDKELHGRMVQAAQGVNPRTLETISQDPDGAGLHRSLAAKLRAFAIQWVG